MLPIQIPVLYPQLYSTTPLILRIFFKLKLSPKYLECDLYFKQYPDPTSQTDRSIIMSETAVASVPPPQQQQESKSAKKKKAKAEAPAKPNAPSDGETAHVATEGPTNGADSAYESPYLKELYK